MIEGNGTGLALSLSLAGLPEDAILQLTLPAVYSHMSLGRLLESVFPEDEADRLPVEELLDVAENPDLPDIYDCFLPVFDQYRSGLCRLKLTAAAGQQARLSDIAIDHLQPALHPQSAPAGSGNSPAPVGLELTIEPEYQALDYAAAQGYGGGREELLAWLRSCTLLYFLDRHEYRLPAWEAMTESDPLRPIAAGLFHQGLLRASGPTGYSEIAPEGRRFIQALLAETEACIDRFDLFKDTLWDEDTGAAEFDTGYGADLRVQVFIAEGLDPVRTVFLLRLYDGTLDEFAATWPELIGDTDFFNRILEPVVNRCQVPEELIQEIVEDGYACLEAWAEAAQEERLQANIAREVRHLDGCR